MRPPLCLPSCVKSGAVPGDVYTLRDDLDWQWLSKRTHAKK